MFALHLLTATAVDSQLGGFAKMLQKINLMQLKIETSGLFSLGRYFFKTETELTFGFPHTPSARENGNSLLQSIPFPVYFISISFSSHSHY